MSKNKYEAVFCDLGNVLINFDHKIAVKKISRYTLKNEEETYQLFFDSNLTKDYEEGKITSFDFCNRVRDFLQLDMDCKAFLPIWEDIFFETPLSLKMQDFIRKMKGKYKLLMISNINEAHYEYLRHKMPIFNEFDKIILSYKVGYRKPSPEIYKAALGSLETAPSKVFYIDDRADLIEAAFQLGINGITFNGKEAFKKIKTALL